MRPTATAQVLPQSVHPLPTLSQQWPTHHTTQVTTNNAARDNASNESHELYVVENRLQ